MNFQARLQSASGAIVPDGNYHIEFKLYSAASGGSALWTETHSTGNLVRVVNGYLTVNLGSVTPFPSTMNWDQEHWLTMNVGGSGGSPSYDGEMTPRLKLTAVPYAFNAGQLRKTLGANTSILDFLNPTANRTINLPDQDGTLCIQGSSDCVDVATTSTTAATSSNSGLEISADGLRLLGGCADGEMMRWNAAASTWDCSSGSGSSFTVRESDGTPSTTVTNALEFGPGTNSDDEFIVSNQGGGVTRITLGTTVITTSNYAAALDSAYVNVGESPAVGDVSGSFTAGLLVNSVQNNSVDLGTDTVGSYVATLGTLTGLSTTGNSGEGSTPTLSVLYGAAANTAVQGDTTLVCPSGSGNLTGGGNTITLGSGGTCNALTTNAAVNFGTSVTTPLLTNAGTLNITSTATAGADDIVFSSAGTESLRILENGDFKFERGTNDAFFSVATPSGAPATYTFSGATGTVLTTANYAASGLDAAYVNVGESPATGDITGSFSGGLTVGANAVALGTDTTGDYVQNLGTLVGLSTSGNSGEGSTPGLSVLYGNSASTAVQGNTTLVCASGSGDLSGGGNTITLGTGGTCSAIAIGEAPVFDTSVTTPLITYGGALTVQTTATAGADDLIFKTAGTEIMRLLENGNIYLEKGTNDVTIAVNTPGAPATYTFDGATGTVLTTANYTTNLDGTYVNVGESPAAGDISGSFAAGLSVNDVQNNAVDLGTETVGDYVQNLGTLVGLSTSGNSGEGSTPGLSVLYGSGANNAAAGSNTFTCTSGTGNLTGGGTTVTIGTSGTTCAAINTNNAVTFTTSVTTPLVTNAGVLTVSTTGANDLTISSGSGLVNLGATTVSTTAGLTFDLVNASNDVFTIRNTGAGIADLNLADGGLQIAGTTVLTSSKALQNLTGLTVSSGGASITGDLSLLTGDLDVVAGVIKTNSITRVDNSGNLTNIGNITGAGVLTLSSTGGANALTLTSGSGTIVLGSNTLQRSASSFTFDLANAGTSTFNISNSNGSNVTNLDVSGALAAGSGNAFSVNADGDLTSVFRLLDGSTTTNGTSGITPPSTSLTVTSAANFDVGNYVEISDTNCGGTGVNPCYAKITAKAGNVLTITPGLTWTTGKNVKEYHIPEIGGIDTTQALANRYGRGYFISGVATGNGTTYYNENSIETSLSNFDLLNTVVATLNIGGATTTISLGGVSTTVNLPGNLSLGGTQRIDSSGNLTNIASITGSGALVIASGGSGDLTLDSASNTIAIASSDTTLKHTAAGTYTIDLSDGSATTLQLTNSGAGAANLDLLEGSLSTAGTARLTNSGALQNITGLTVTSGGASITGGLTLATGALNLTSGGITNAGAIAGASTINASGLVTSVGLNAGTGLIQNSSGGLTIVGAISLDGTLIDPTGNLVLDDTVDIGSATTGIRVGTDGSILDIDGNIVLNDQLNLGSSATGLLVTTGGVVSDIDGNIVFDDTTDVGSATTGLRVATDGSLLDIDGNLVLNDQVLVGSSTTGLQITTDGVITDIDDSSVQFGENLTVTSGGITITGNSTIAGTLGGLTGLSLVSDAGTNTSGLQFGSAQDANLYRSAAGTLKTDGALVITGNLTNNGSGLFKNSSNGTTALEVQNSAGSSIFVVDTQNGRIGINQTAPARELHVNGIARFDRNADSAGVMIHRTGLKTFFFGVDAVGTNDGTFFISDFGSAVSGASTRRFSINNSGQVSIGTGTANDALDVTGSIDATTGYKTNGTAGLTIAACTAGQYIGNGVATAGGIITAGSCRNDATGLSDVRLKKDITSVDSTLDKLKDIGVVTFNFRVEDFPELNLDHGLQYGVIAQQLEQIFPELVSTRDDGYKEVNFKGLSFYNLKAVTEIAQHLDSSGNANLDTVAANSLTVTGDITAGTIRADHIEGLDYIGRFESLEARVSTLESQQTSGDGTQQQIDLQNLAAGNFTTTGTSTFNGETTFKAKTQFDKEVAFGDSVTINGQTDVQGLTVNLDLIARGSLQVNGAATFKEAARFEKDVQFDGQINVLGYGNVQGLTVNLDLIVKGSLEIQGPATFKEAVKFEKDASFEGSVAVKGQATFNNDTAGKAIIKQGETSIKVMFKNPKERPPIISLTLGDGKFAQYSYRNVTERDFEIVLSQPASEDLTFSWIAILTEQEVGVVQ